MGAPPVVLRRPSLGLAAAGMVVAACLWLRWSSYDGFGLSDFDVYVRGARAILRDENLYAVSAHGLPFTYSPFAAGMFTPLTLVPLDVAGWGFTLGSLACYLAIVVVCARSARIGLQLGVIVGAAGLALEPFVSNIDLGQINLYLILMVILDCLVVPARYRGWLVGLAAGIKIVPGVFILYFVLKRDWPAVRRTVAGFAVSVAVGALLAPTDSWRYWSGGFLNVRRFGADVALRGDNQSLSAEFIRITHDLTPARVVLLALSALALLVAVLVARRALESDRPLDAMVALGLGSVLASPVSWSHHWLWVIPLLVVTVSRRWLLTSWAIGVVFLIGPMWKFPSGQFRELEHEWWQAALCASYVIFGVGLLVRLFVVQPRLTAGTTAAVPVGPSPAPLVAIGRMGDARVRPTG